jgi:acetyl esterase/lipase
VLFDYVRSNRTAANQVFLDDLFQDGRVARGVPRAFGVDDRDRPAFANSQAVGLRAQDAALLRQPELLQSAFQELPRRKPAFLLTAFRRGLIATEKNVAAGYGDADAFGAAFLGLRHWSILRRMIHLVIAFIALASVAAAEAQVNVTPDLDYIPRVDYAHGKDRLDIYTPAGATKAPVVLMFHGGGLTGGDRKDETRFGHALASHGYVVVSASYRLSPGVTHPAHIEDAAAAFAWVKRNIAGWSGDADRVFVAGYSAGGYLAALLGSDDRYLKAHDLSTADVAGLILIAATFDLKNRPADMKGPWGSDPHTWETASPARHFGAHVPRTLMIVGAQDEAWRLRDHREAAAALGRFRKGDISFRIVDDRDHLTIRRKPSEDQAEPTMAEILRFLADRGDFKGAKSARRAGKSSALAFGDVEGRAPQPHVR